VALARWERGRAEKHEYGRWIDQLGDRTGCGA